MTISENPVPYSTVSCIPGGDVSDVNVSIVVDRRTYRKMLSILTEGAHTEEQRQVLLRKRSAQQLKRVSDAEAESGTPRPDTYYANFRVFVASDLHAVRGSRRHVFTYYRYSLRYHVAETGPAVQATYTSRIVYNLVDDERGHRLECVTNSSSALGESGSPFAHIHLDADDETWVRVIRESYLGPYRLLERALAIMQVTDITKLRTTSMAEWTVGDFKLPFTEQQLVEALRINTFGFRFLYVMDEPHVAARDTILFMLHSLYSSEYRAANAGVSVSKNLRIKPFATRRSDRAEDVFTWTSEKGAEEPSVDHEQDENYTKMASQARSSARLLRDDPLTSIRLAIHAESRHLRYHLDVSKPSARFMQRLYLHTDAREHVTTADSQKDRKRRRQLWKSVAQRGLIIGVDAHSFYLRERGINTLSDLLRIFSGKYRHNYREFCTSIMDRVLKDINYRYWMGSSWHAFVAPGYAHPKMEPSDTQLWSWLRRPQNAHLSLVQAMAAYKHVTLGPRNKLSREDEELVVGVARNWIQSYGYNPLYPLVAHFAVLQNWYQCENLGQKFALERRGVTVAQRIDYARYLFNEGAATQLARTVMSPTLPAPAASAIR